MPNWKETDSKPKRTAPLSRRSPSLRLSDGERAHAISFAALLLWQILQKRKGVFSQQYPGLLQVSKLQRINNRLVDFR
jgi:hypothetical protein